MSELRWWEKILDAINPDRISYRFYLKEVKRLKEENELLKQYKKIYGGRDE